MDWVVGVRAGGLIRGVIKLLWHICRDRVKLKVTCSEPEEGWVHLMVLNSSAFPVKIRRRSSRQPNRSIEELPLTFTHNSGLDPDVAGVQVR